MKYANIAYSGKSLNNLGDNIQLIAIDHIYEAMGISEEDIVYIPLEELPTYAGEYVVLPINMPMLNYYPGGLCGMFSPYIIPVFLGLSLLPDTLEEQEVAFLRRFSPIGCRDERTLMTMRKYHIDAYLGGCITITLPHCDVDRTKLSTVFIADAPKNLIPHIPEELLKRAQFITHTVNVGEGNPKDEAKKLYARYKNEAALVITSLLHAFVPCLAAGIPVILVREEMSYRFGWAEKLHPLYTQEQYEHIDWAPVATDVSVIKTQVLDLCINRLNSVFQQNQKFLDLSWYYENREKKEYVVDHFRKMQGYIDTHFNKDVPFEYGIWGVTHLSSLVAEYLQKNYPLAKLVKVFDKRVGLSFKGFAAESPESIITRKDLFIFFTAFNSLQAAKDYFQTMGKPENSYVFWNYSAPSVIPK